MKGISETALLGCVDALCSLGEEQGKEELWVLCVVSTRCFLWGLRGGCQIDWLCVDFLCVVRGDTVLQNGRERITALHTSFGSRLTIWVATRGNSCCFIVCLLSVLTPRFWLRVRRKSASVYTRIYPKKGNDIVVCFMWLMSFLSALGLFLVESGTCIFSTKCPDW